MEVDFTERPEGTVAVTVALTATGATPVSGVTESLAEIVGAEVPVNRSGLLPTV
jgi:hypothetical protein